MPRDIFACQLIIPTVDTAKYYYLMNLFVENSNPFLLLGPPGTGKSVYIKDLLTRKLDHDKFASVTLFFTSNTSPTTTQNIIMSKLDKRRKGEFVDNTQQYLRIISISLNSFNRCLRATFGQEVHRVCG